MPAETKISPLQLLAMLGEVSLATLLSQINGKLDRVLERLDALDAEEIVTMLNLDELTQRVAETETVEASAATLIATIATELHDAAADPAAVHSLADRLKAGSDALAAAVAANTPAAPTPPATPAAESTPPAAADPPAPDAPTPSAN